MLDRAGPAGHGQSMRRAPDAASSTAEATAAESIDTLVVCPPPLVSALEPWLQLRRGQGHRVRLATDWRLADDIKAAVREAAAAGTLRYVVLVGDVVDPRTDARRRAEQVPTCLVPARVNVRWGSEPDIATDNSFADLDDDGLPELAIGRLPADSAADLSNLVRKIESYERHPAGLWCRRVNLVAGVGGFGPVTDAVLETATRSLISQGIPAEYCTSMTYASWRSPYFPDPRAFRQKTLDRLNEGCLFWVYVGHGRREGLDWVHVPPGVAPILERTDAARVRSTDGLPIAIFLSCYTGALDDPEDCLAELLLQQEAGPVAVLGGSRVTLPYGMAVLGSALMRETFQHQRGTLGEVLLHAKRTLGSGESSGPDRSWLDLLARTLSPTAGQLAEERLETVQLFNLLGDPLLRMRYPLPLEIAADGTVHPGQELAIECRAPWDGEVLVELVCRRGRLTFKPASRVEFDESDGGMRALNASYERANDDRYVQRRLQTTSRGFRTTLEVPADAEGPCLVRVYSENGSSCALGARAVYVQRRLAEGPVTAAKPQVTAER